MDYSNRKIIGGTDFPGTPWSPVLVEVYYEVKSGKGDNKHVRPVKGQLGFPQEFDAKFPEEMKAKAEIGDQYLMWGKISRRNSGQEYVNSHWGWTPEKI